MHKQLPLAAALSAASLVGVNGMTRQHTASVQGVWRTAEVRLTGPNATTIPQPPSLAIITTKYYTRVEIHGPPHRPGLADPAKATADELRATWGPFFAEAGTYEISGVRLTMHPSIAKNPAAADSGWFATYEYRLAGDTLWLTEQRNQRGAITSPMTIKLTRVE